MCLIAFAWQAHPRWRLLLLGNRDEFHARPSAALARWKDKRIIGGRDLQAGGTWLGVTDAGHCCVVTNVRDPRDPQLGVSRGMLATDFLDSRVDAATHARQLLRLALQSANLLSLSFQSNYKVTAKFDNIGGLKPKAAIKSKNTYASSAIAKPSSVRKRAPLRP